MEFISEIRLRSPTAGFPTHGYHTSTNGTHMLDELTQLYTSLKTKVHDLREYL
jgi:hypothetical protein